MSDIRSTLTSNIDEKLRIGPEIFGESKKESFELQSDSNKATTGRDGAEDAAGSGKKKKFQQLRNAITGFRANRKNNEKPGIISESNMNVSRSEKSNRFFLRNSSSSSTIGRMWSSLFPNKEMQSNETESQEHSGVGGNMKSRSTKTLGRIFGHRTNNADVVNAKNEIPTPAAGGGERRQKSNTLGRRISESLRNLKSANSPSSTGAQIPVLGDANKLQQQQQQQQQVTEVQGQQSSLPVST